MDLELVLESAPALIHTARPDGYLDFFNQTWLTYVGQSQEDLQGWKWTTAIHPDDLEGMLRAWHSALATGEPFLHEARVRRADGAFRWMLHHKVALRDERGAIVSWCGSSIDIEDRRRTEDALRANEERYRVLFEVSPQIVMVMDADGTNSHFNQFWYDYSGLTPDENEGSGWAQAVHPDYRDRVLERFQQGIASGEGWLLEAPVRRADGQYRWILGRGRPIRDADGRILQWMGVGIDIHERREAEEELRRTKTWLSEAQRLSHTGSFAQNLDTGRLVYASPELLRIYGFDPADGIPSREAVLGRFHPEDLPKVAAELERVVREKTGYSAEWRLVLPDGTMRYLEASADPVFDADGRCVELIGTNVDVTERKRAEAAQRESDERYRAIIEVSPQMVWTMSADGMNMQTNQWWYEYTGLTRPETEGLDSVHPEHRRRLWKSWRQAVALGAEWTDEAPFRRATDGQYRWHLLRGRPVRDADGRILRWMGIGIDIHDRREAEEALRRTEAWLSEAQRLSHTGSFALSVDTGELIYASPEFLRIFGFDPAAGVPSRDAIIRRFHTEDQLGVVETSERVAREKTAAQSPERRLVLPDGTMRYVESRVGPIFDAAGRPVEIIGTTIDVTERKRAEQALRESEARYRNIFEKVGVAILEQDYSRLMARLGELKASGVRDFRRYLAEHPEFARETLDLVRDKDVNETAVAMLGASSKEEFRRALPRLNTGVMDTWTTQLIAVAEGRDSVEEVVLNTLRNESIHALVSIVLPRESSGFHSVLVTAVDLSERKNAEKALNEAQAALAHVTRVTTIGELTASIAHEVNQPLAAIVNNANASLSFLAQDPTDVEELRAALEDITSDAERASAVIERVRSMVKRSPSMPAPLRIADVVDDVVALAAAESERRRVAIRSEVAEDLPVVAADRVQLQQVLLNLVVNAMDAMASVPESERLLEIRARRDLRNGRPVISVSVRDRGVGLKDTDLDRLFDAFYSTKPTGMGMGLAISRSIIEAHQGSLWAEANRGAGATFSFALPTDLEP